MNTHFNFSLDNSGYNSVSWFDIGPSRDDSGQTLSFPDYVYGTIKDINIESDSLITLRVLTTDGTAEISVVPGTNFIGCLPDDMAAGRKLAIAVSRDTDRIIARKVMLFSGY